MSGEITIHTGNQGDHTGINVDWFDENNNRHSERIAVMVENQDKPRTLVITVNGHLVAKMAPSRIVHTGEVGSQVEDPNKVFTLGKLQQAFDSAESICAGHFGGKTCGMETIKDTVECPICFFRIKTKEYLFKGA